MKHQIIDIFNTNKTIFISVLSLFIIKVINYLFPLFVIPFLVSAVGVTEFGKYSLLLIYAYYIQLIGEYGFNLTATKKIANFLNESNYEKIDYIFSSITNLKLMYGIILFMITFLGLQFLDYSHEFYLFICGGVFVGFWQSFFPLWLFQGLQKMQVMAVLTALSKVLMLFGYFIFINNPQDYWKIPLVQSSSLAILSLSAYLYAFKSIKVSYIKVNFVDTLEVLKEGLSIFLSRLSSTLYKQFPMMVLGWVAPLSVVGAYSIADKVIRTLQSTQNVLGDALFPHFASNSNSYRLCWKWIRIVFIIYVLSSICVFFVSGIVSELLLDEGVDILSLVLKLLSFVIFFGGGSYVLGVLGLVVKGHNREFLISTIISGCFTVIISLPLINYLSYIGAGLSVLLGEIMLFVLVTSFCFKKRLF